MATVISKKRKVRVQQGSGIFLGARGRRSTSAPCPRVARAWTDGILACSDVLASAVSRGGVAQFVADGVFYAELNELLTRELAENGYSGVEVRVTPLRTEIIIKATRTQDVLGEQAKYTTPAALEPQRRDPAASQQQEGDWSNACSSAAASRGRPAPRGDRGRRATRRAAGA